MTKEKTLEEWQQSLTPEQFQVCRMQGTERPFTGKYYKIPHKAGIYYCVCCHSPLFETTTQFETGCGWPSFYQSINPEAVVEKDDISHNMYRTEVRCSQCDAHLGHVFSDGPPPTGLRYCINSIALSFEVNQ